MSPDLLFLLSLAVKMAVTALFVLVATYAAERAGALVGAMIATLPIAAGPAYIFLALDHDARFIADSALASLMLILHPRIGGRATAAVEANSLLGLVGFALTCLTARLAVEPLGTAAGLSLALAVSIGCNLLFWRLRRARA